MGISQIAQLFYVVRVRAGACPQMSACVCAHAPVETLVISYKQPSQGRSYYVDINIVITISDTAPEVNFV